MQFLEMYITLNAYIDEVLKKIFNKDFQSSKVVLTIIVFQRPPVFPALHLN